MSKRLSKSFTLEFVIARDGEKFSIQTDLPLRAPPPGTLMIHSDWSSDTAVRILPRLTMRLQRLLKAMVEREQEDTDRVTPVELISDMEKIVLAAYRAARNDGGVRPERLMSEIVEPSMSIGWCATAVAETMESMGKEGYDSYQHGYSSAGHAFIKMLIEAAIAAAHPKNASSAQDTNPPRPAVADHRHSHGGVPD